MNRIHSNEETQSLQIEYDKMEHAAYMQNELLLNREQDIAKLRLGLLKIRSQLEINQKEYQKKHANKTALYYDIINNVKSIVSIALGKLWNKYKLQIKDQH